MFGTDVDFIETLKFVKSRRSISSTVSIAAVTSASTGFVVLELAQVLGQRARVDADAQRRAALLGQRDHLGDLLRAADVAGVQAHAVGARFDRLQRERVVEVDVGDHRDRRLARRSSSAPRRPARAAPPRARCPRRPPRPCGSAPSSPRRFAVSVLVIVCTATGAPPPIGTGPTWIWRSEAMADSTMGARAMSIGPRRLRHRPRPARAPRLAARRPRPRAPPRALLRAHAARSRARACSTSAAARSACARSSPSSTSPASTSPSAPTTRARSCAPTRPTGLPFADGEFDLVYCSSVIEHVAARAPRGVRRRAAPRRARLVRADARAAPSRSSRTRCCPAPTGCPSRLRRRYWRLGAAGGWEEIALLRRARARGAVRPGARRALRAARQELGVRAAAGA